MKKSISNIIFGISVISIVLNIYFLTIKKAENKTTLPSSGVITENIKNYKFSLVSNKLDAFVDCVFPLGSVRIETSSKGKDLRVISQPANGEYVFLCDENSDGFVDFGVKRKSGERVKFAFGEKPF